jgi:hypothetical protein
MRTGTLFALCGAAMLAFVSVSQASPLAASGATNVAIQNAMADEGITQVRHRRHYRHWNRGHHYGWRHRSYRPAYGYYRPHHRRGVAIYLR